MAKTNFSQNDIFEASRTKFGLASAAEVFAAMCMVEGTVWVGKEVYTSTVKIGDQHLMDKEWDASIGVSQIRCRWDKSPKYRDQDYIFGSLARQIDGSVSIWKAAGKKFTDWTSYTGGTYRGYMLKAQYNPVPSAPANMHLIAGGESLSAIAAQARYQGKFRWQDLALVNGLSAPYTIQSGKMLKLPVWGYRVASGDNLTRIAATYTHLTVPSLAEYNKLSNPDRLAVGETIWIPDPAVLPG